MVGTSLKWPFHFPIVPGGFRFVMGVPLVIMEFPYFLKPSSYLVPDLWKPVFKPHGFPFPMVFSMLSQSVFPGYSHGFPQVCLIPRRRLGSGPTLELHRLGGPAELDLPGSAVARLWRWTRDGRNLTDLLSMVQQILES